MKSIPQNSLRKKNNFLYNMKLSFDPSSLKLNSIDSQEFLKGIELYDDGAVFDVKLYKMFNDESLEDIIKFNAKVGDPETKPHEITIKIDRNGDINFFSCGCDNHMEHKFAYCKHIIAVLLYLYNNNKLSDIRNKKTSALLDSNFSNLINCYKEKLYNETVTVKSLANIKLIPKLLLNSQGFIELYLNIGTNNKFYVVKNIFALAENIKFSSNNQYGKNFELNHNINNFTKESKALAKLIVNLCYEYMEVYGYSTELLPSKKSIRIPNSQLDILFDLFSNSKIEFTCNNKSYDLTFVNDNPKLSFGLEKNYANNKYDFFIEDFFENNVHIFKFLNKAFIIYKEHFYRCTDEFIDNVLPAIEKVEQSRNLSIPISLENLSVFYSTVLLRLEKYANIRIPDDITNSFILYPLNAKVYLDTNKTKAIYASVAFCYGSIEINPLNNKLNSKNDSIENNKKSFIAKNNNNSIVIRDLEKEMKIISFFKENGFVEKEKNFVLSSENLIYNFITTTINDLIKISEVNASESFGKIKLRNPNSISMGIKLNNNLIELDMENLEFNLTELKDILKQYKIKKKYFRLKDGSFLNLNDSYFSTIETLSNELNLLNELKDDHKMYIPSYRSLHIESIIKKNSIISANKSNNFKEIIENLNNIQDSDFQIPESLNGILRNYQKTGFKWLKTLAHYSLGGILADDMGLGKTLQIIALLLSENENNKPSIVICPTSLIFNWLNEVDKFTKDLKAVVITGNKSQRIEAIENAKDVNLIITSYDLLKRDIDIYKKFNFKYCILDEAQYIKNSYTQNAASVKCINSEIRFALTGTPIENSLSDLWSIFDFIMPKFLLSYKDFKEKYESPIVKDNCKEALKSLNNQIKPFILRRLKSDVLKELPDKMEISSYTKMEEKQRKLYAAELIKVSEEFNETITNVGYEKSQIKILSMLTRLRQICCHPSLYIDNYTGESAKLNLCMQIVQDSIENGHKILIYSQFTSMLDIIAKELSVNEIPYYLLTGSTKSAERIRLIDEFNNNNIPVFLISLKAGGTGLNLTGADIVIHYDPWWNSSAQNQATDRAHRIGQKNKVQVFKLITKDTIEEKIEKMQQKKQNLANSIITEKEILFSSLTKEEIKELLNNS